MLQLKLRAHGSGFPVREVQKSCDEISVTKGKRGSVMKGHVYVGEQEIKFERWRKNLISCFIPSIKKGVWSTNWKLFKETCSFIPVWYCQISSFKTIEHRLTGFNRRQWMAFVTNTVETGSTSSKHTVRRSTRHTVAHWETELLN